MLQSESDDSFPRTVLALQGSYYLATGAWPLFSMRSFERLLGPKTDDWLVYMVGLLAIAIGCALLVGARPAAPRLETRVLAAASALAFAGIDLVFVLAGTISPVYLADAAFQLVFLAFVVASAGRPGGGLQRA